MNNLAIQDETLPDKRVRANELERGNQPANRYDFIGKSIKAIREERGLSQTDVANLANLSQAQMSNYEKGINLPLPDSILKICKALEVDPLVFALKCLEQTELIDSRNALLVAEYEEIAQETVNSIHLKRQQIHQRETIGVG